MLKTLSLLTALIFSSVVSYSQSGASVPDILPPSPTAMQIAKYSLTGASMSTGAANMSLPLYTYATTNLQIPISLNYNSTGLKVDQVASRVGLGWMLDAGGMISRTVYGDADETTTHASIPSDFPNTTGSALSSFINSVVTAHTETQADIYNFSFGGYSGRFTLFNGTAKKLEQNNLIISGSPASGFTIITPDGVKYEFTAVESSKSVNSANTKYRIITKNAWCLTKITHPEGDVIYLKYQTCEFSYLSSVNQTYTHLDGEQSPGDHPCAGNSTSKTYNQLTNYGVLLKEISSNSRKGGILKFGYTEREDLPGDSCLIFISLYDGIGDRFYHYQYFNSSPKKAIELYYNTITKGTGTPYNSDASINKRLFLVGLTNDDQYYEFKYKNLDKLPPRLSFAQDNYGYYNGKTSNGSLIPKPNSAILINSFETYGFADRRPDWNFSQNGLLTKVTYPTGGYDSLEYEANRVYVTSPPNCENPDTTIHVMMYGNAYGHADVRNYYTNILNVTCQQTVKANVTCNYGGTGTPGGDPSDYLVTADLVDNLGASINWRDVNNSELQATLGQSKVYYATLSPGIYRLKVLVLDYCSGLVTFDINNSFAQNGNKEVSGVRVKRILSYDKASSFFNHKNYIYDTLSNSRSTGVLLDQEPIYQYSYKSYVRIDETEEAGPACQHKECYYTKLSSSNYFEANATGNHIFYRGVTESMGDNFENGGTEHVFYIGEPNPIGAFKMNNPIPGAPLSNSGMFSGKEQRQRTFKKSGSNFITLKDIITNYTIDTRLSDSTVYYVLQANPSWDQACTINLGNLEDYFWLNISSYLLRGRWQYPSSVQTIIYDTNGLNPVTTTESYIYDSAVHQQLSKTVTVNSKGETFTKQNYYPPDAISGLSTDAANAKNALNTQHIIAPVLYQKEYKGTTSPVLLSGLRTNYFIWPDSLLLPKNIETSYATNAFEQRVAFNKYDKNGNTLEQQQTGGPKQAYLWDYTHAFVTAQALNAGYNDIAYTSFEADSSGNWSIASTVRDSVTAAITGRKSYTLSSGNITKAGLTSGTTYIISYWLRSGTPLTITGTISGYPKTGRSYNGWTYYEHRVTGITTATITGSAKIDELRLYPLNAQMKSYTYNPLTGISTLTDEKNNISYYEYDDFNRLKNIKDQEGNIIKNYLYHFAGVGVNYGAQLIYHNAAQSKAFQRNNCGANYGTHVTYTVAADLYTSTVSQADADAQAMAVVNANGQAYANTNGTCLTCTGNDKKIINDACVDGERVNTHYSPGTCTYYYVFPDGIRTGDYTESSTGCLIGIIQN